MLRIISSFALVGGLTAALYLGLFSLLLYGVGWPYVAAVSMAYGAAVAVHFLANRNFTFQAQRQSIAGQLLRYAVLLFVNYLLTLGIVATIVEAMGLSALIGAIAALVCTMCVSFAVSRYWIFRAETEND